MVKDSKKLGFSNWFVSGQFYPWITLMYSTDVKLNLIRGFVLQIGFCCSVIWELMSDHGAWQHLYDEIR